MCVPKCVSGREKRGGGLGADTGNDSVESHSYACTFSSHQSTLGNDFPR